jgi:glutathione S-transferase
MAMQLCGVSVSPYFERVFLALDMKGATKELDYPGVPGGFKSDEHFMHHPMGMVPFLIKDDGSSLTEGQIIMEYLDAVVSGPKLIPENADDAAQVAAIARVFDLYYYAAQRPFGSAYFGGTETEEDMKNAREVEIPKALAYLEKYMGEGERAVGNSWSTADAVLISQLYWYERVGDKYELPNFDAFPKLKAYWDKIKVTDVAKRSFERVGKSFDQFFGGK